MSKLDPRLTTVLEMMISVLPDEIGCDDASEFLAVYAEYSLSGTALPDALKPMQEHLERCEWCMEELELVVRAMKAEKSS